MVIARAAASPESASARKRRPVIRRVRGGPRNRPRRRIASLFGAALAVAALHAGPARAEMRRITLTPASATLALKARALGLFAIDIAVRRFTGELTYDPAAPATCQAEVTADVASMHVANPDRQALLLGPGFMDAAHYPTFTFRGRCAPDGKLAGWLTMRGVTRPFTLRLYWKPGTVRAEGRIVRGRWGITAMPIAVGPIIDVTIIADTR